MPASLFFSSKKQIKNGHFHFYKPTMQNIQKYLVDILELT
jgi:Holliday junction resolvase RusA-like endonuclease